MAVVGPGAQQNATVDVAPLLEGASEFEYVTILNPLTDDFAVRVAQDVPVNMPFAIGKDITGKTQQLTNSDADARQVYGLNLKNPDFQGRKHIINDTIIAAGKTINLKGNEAQVAVRQLVNEILQREGKARLSADPNLRREVEQRIVVRRGTIQDLMDGSIRSQRQQIDDAINLSNEVQNAQEQQPFGGLGQVDETDSSQDGGTSDTQEQPGDSPKRVGRPKATNS